MGLLGSGRESRYCAFCGTEHRIYRKSHVSALDVFICLGIGLLAVTPFTDGFDPRGIGAAAVFVGVAEVFVGLRHRMSLRCGRCGFDPIVYRKSQEQAAALVKAHIERRSRDPKHILAEPVVSAGRRLRSRSTLREDSPQQP